MWALAVMKKNIIKTQCDVPKKIWEIHAGEILMVTQTDTEDYGWNIVHDFL